MDVSSDVVVVGGGPAGSTVARLLVDRGWRTTILDRAHFPRPKPCGECLNPGAVAVLSRLGVLDAVLSLDPAPLQGWRLHGETTVGEGRFGRGLRSLAVPRAELDRTLLDRARERGVAVREGARVVDVTPARGGRRPALFVRERGSSAGDVRTLRPRLVIGADGLRSVVAKAAAGRRPYRSPRKLSLTCHVTGMGHAVLGSLHLTSACTVGLAPIRRDGELWNATVVVPSSRARQVREGPTRFVERTLRATCGLSAAEVVAGPWASGPFHRPVTRAWAPGIVLVGDAAGYFDPLTGQGIFRALRSAELAAAAAERILATDRAGWHPLRAYGRQFRREVAPGRRVQRLVEAVVGRPNVRETAISTLARAEGLGHLIRVTGDAAAPRSLASLGLLLRVASPFRSPGGP